ncbi:MAG: hypothetical protein COB04_18725 [Gammaproteobacteria bacterium]|nr:MAG: hypothetical protein COB04_18725 [Gammaproteobacteria bacterium]
MSKILKLVDAVKAAQNVSSDYAVSKLINLKPTNICDWRAGRRLPTQAMTLELAKLTNDRPEYWVMLIESERAKNEDLATFWADTAEGVGI